MAMESNWQGFITALGKQKPPSSSIDIGPPTVSFPTTVGSQVSSGFYEFNPPAAVQAKYDAMNPKWGGVEISEKAIGKGMFKPSEVYAAANK
jgi:hypothetical protein